jgi:CRISPR/Cas system endoribonuclease Cas6 (RAMP superfamily)
MSVSGLVGEVLCRGDVGTLVPLLRVGTFVHVGRNTTFGLGRIEFELSGHGVQT